MKTFYKIIRTLLISLLVLAIVLPMGLYVAVSLPSVQRYLCEVSEGELSELLGTEVDIESVSISPFNQFVVNNVTIKDDYDDNALKVDAIGAGIDLYELLKNRKIVVTHAALIGVDAKLYKKDPSSPINIQNIIDNLQSKDKDKPPTKFDLRINTVVIRESRASFDILSEPTTNNRFDKNHIEISDLSADIYIPQLKNNDFIFNIKRFQAKEKSGLALTSLCGDFHIAPTQLTAEGLNIGLNNSNLAFGDINIPYSDLSQLGSEIKNTPINISLLDGSHVNLKDLAPFVPSLGNIDEQFYIKLNLVGNLDKVTINSLDIVHLSKNIKLASSGTIRDINQSQLTSFSLPSLSINANGNDIDKLLASFNVSNPNISNKISQLGNISFNGQFSGKPLEAHLLGDITSAMGALNLDVEYDINSQNKSTNARGSISTTDLNLGKLFNSKLGTTTASCDFDINLIGNNRNGNIDAQISHLDFNNYRYNDINAIASLNNNLINADIAINDPNAQLALNGEIDITKTAPSTNISASIPYFSFDGTNLASKYGNISADIEANLNGFNLDTADGDIKISNIRFSNKPGEDLNLSDISLFAQNSSTPQQINLSSKNIDASISGSYSFNTLIPTIKDILANAFPIINNEAEALALNGCDKRLNDFTYNITLYKDEELFKYFNISTKLFSPITIYGNVNQSAQKIDLLANIPYIAQKKKLIENTFLAVDIDKSLDKCQLLVHSELPTKRGIMPIDIICNGIDNRLDTYANWKIDCKERFEGAVDISTLFTRNDDNKFITTIDVNPSQLVFNDSIWNIQQSHIEYADKSFIVENLDIRHADQFINITGKASPSPNDSLCLSLSNVNLDYIFQTLKIKQVNIGGDATGTFYASNLFSKRPTAYTNSLKVKDISYNGAIIGDAKIKSHWDNELGAVCINADIAQPEVENSRIDCEIYPIKQAFDLRIYANKVDASFMAPFLSSFASDVQGRASGYARVFGPFKNVNLEGDVLAEDFKLKVNFTNVYYHTTDSIHMRPGNISMKDITLYDPNGNTATLNGWLKHDHFRNAEFEFNITEAKNFLSYNIKESPTDTWFGHINGNGFARIEGKPGVVNINVEMEAAAKSTFTFVLSDTESAYDYNFLTFRDKNSIGKETTTKPTSNEPLEVTLFREQSKKIVETSSTDFNLTIIADITPEAQLTLVMDPVGGDKIKGYGSGQLKLFYGSANEDLKMYGTYEIDKGSYNFTLQDIIIKDFKLRDNSKVAFEGDPLAAKLDIWAVYPVKANLSDLDEAFLEDKSVNNTNVPIDVVFHINGIMTQPDIDYKLEFPSFANTKGDIESKVNSIVSTEDMMKRQCLYLLVLNRFYTPEYMSTTSGNELFSVASSTISSQLSAMLGQLSENWTISPNLRSNLGDFSDVEVDVALSSTLLNNRLRLNGNFGYRDKSLNSNQFIGDFDLEYLLTPRGSWRLKAYNRYNDQNYYIKTATTTQGVGIMYRQDFDSLFPFIKSKKKNNKNNSDSTVVDSIKAITPILPSDSTAIQEEQQ